MRELLLGKPVKTLEAARKEYEKYKKEKGIKHLNKRKAEGKLKGKDSKESIYIQSLKKSKL